MTPLKRNGRSNITPSIWDALFNTDVLNGDSQNFVNTGNSMPAVNIKETSESFFVEMAAPGMEKKDFKIQLDGSDLTISSERQNESDGSAWENYNRKEFSYQSFYRTFHLPKEVVNADKIQAKYENGLLRLEIPKRDEAKQRPPRFIQIQ
jgi:HSP20 family protein